MIPRIEPLLVMTRRLSFTTHININPWPSVKCIVISIYLNFVCYLILYTRLFMKLNLFKILVTTMKVSRFMVGGWCVN